jgi:Tol biopolymer transport system component/DNA-binding winged helix-turn-helix (wHTH) protein
MPNESTSSVKRIWSAPPFLQFGKPDPILNTMKTQLKHTSIELSQYRFGHKIYEKGSGKLFLVIGQQLEELETLSLTHQAYLNFLIEKQAQLATFDELTQLEGKHVNNNTVSKHIGKIKKNVGCDIENVPRQGYRLHSQPQLVDISHFQLQSESKSKNTKTSPFVFVLTLVLLLCGMSWFYMADGSALVKVPYQKATMLQGSEFHGLLSPDGRFLAFEYQEPKRQTADLWIKNLTTGEKLRLTAPKAGVEDEISAFSANGSKLLFHRTDEHSNCSINEIVFSQFDPVAFTQKQLFSCEHGYRSINAEYGKDHNTIYFTDYTKFEEGHMVFRYDRLNDEVSKIFSLDNSGQGVYRVYPLPDSNELILLSSNDWSTTVIYQLDLSNNKLVHLIDVPGALKSIALDRNNKAIYYLNQTKRALVRFSLIDHQLSEQSLPLAHDSFISISQNGRQLAIDGNTVHSKKIVQLKNPLKHPGYEVVQEISSSGSDSLPRICADSIYFFSDRTGSYNLWKKVLSQDIETLVYAFDYAQLPKDYSLSPSCSKVAVVDNTSSLKLIDLAVGEALYTSKDEKFISATWFKEDEILASVQDDGYRLNRFLLKDFSFVRLDALPQSKTFLLANDNKELWLLGHLDNELLIYNFQTQQKISTNHTISLFRNSSWVNWRDKGIYYHLDNQINPVLSYVNIKEAKSAKITLPKSYRNAHLTMATESDDLLWIVQNKSSERDIYLFDLK